MSHLYMKGRKAWIPALLFAASMGWEAGAEDAASSPGYESYVLAPAEGLPNGRNGRLKANGRSTRGNYSVVVRESQTSQSADPHNHSHLVEAWYVVEGQMTFQSLGMSIEAPAGTFVLVPPTVEHGFKVDAGKTLKVVQVLSPPDFEKLFSERLELPSYDPSKEISRQSARWRADQKDIARRYGGGPAEQVSKDLPRVIKPLAGNKRRELASMDSTAGRYTLAEETLAPGSVPVPMDVSPETDDAWYVLSGELHYSVRTTAGLQKRVLRPGDFAFLPRGTPFNLSNPARQEARFLHWESTPRDQPPR